MHTTQLLRSALIFTRDGLNRLIADIKGPQAAMTRPAPGSGNHPTWVMGHLCAVESAIQASIAGEPNRHEHLWKLFAPGTQPSSDASAYPPFDDLIRTFNTIREDTLKLLDKVGDAGLDKPPSFIPPGFEDAMSSTGKTFMLIPLHQMVHYGQITDCRRAAGLKPLL
ncbi:MAG: DinB family protein [Phycisphaerales bacterium]|nr:DinB family protein [Phycisphaerales bacterium]